MRFCIALLFSLFFIWPNVFGQQPSVATIVSNYGWTAYVKITPVRILVKNGCTNPTSYSYYNYEIEYQIAVTFTGSENNRSLYIQQYFTCSMGSGNEPFTDAYHYTQNTVMILSSTNGARTVSSTSNQWNASAGRVVYNYDAPAVPCNKISLANANCSTVRLNYWGGASGNQNINIGVSPLPIELIAFDATANDNQVDLNWSTGSERDNDYFTIERTLDGINFEVVGTVKGSGNSSIKNDYSYTDYNPFNGVSYYRLKQTDFNGAFEYFDVQSVTVKKSSFNSNVYPNPTSTGTVKLTVPQNNEMVQLKIYNLMGQLSGHQIIDAREGDKVEELLLPEVGNAFILELSANNSVIARHKIIKK